MFAISAATSGSESVASISTRMVPWIHRPRIESRSCSTVRGWLNRERTSSRTSSEFASSPTLPRSESRSSSVGVAWGDDAADSVAVAT